MKGIQILTEKNKKELNILIKYANILIVRICISHYDYIIAITEDSQLQKSM